MLHKMISWSVVGSWMADVLIGELQSAVGDPPAHPRGSSSVSQVFSSAQRVLATTLPTVRMFLLIMTIAGGLLAFVAAVWVAELAGTSTSP